MRLRPYRNNDLQHILRKAHDDKYGEIGEAATLELCTGGNTLVFEHDGIPVAILGIRKLWPGVAAIWSIISNQIRGHGLELTRASIAILNDYAKAQEIRRYEAAVKSDIEENGKWLTLLGFKYECTHNQAALDGSDLDIYVRFYA